MSERIASLLALIETGKPLASDPVSLLKDILSLFECVSGTIHILHEEDGMLHIRAHAGIPDFLLPKMAVIPVGKGMAGAAAQRMAPVQICNLQTDESGVVRPSAKETRVEGAITVPMLLGGRLYGTLGIAKSVPYDFTDRESEELMRLGEGIARGLHLQVAGGT